MILLNDLILLPSILYIDIFLKSIVIFDLIVKKSTTGFGEIKMFLFKFVALIFIMSGLLVIIFLSGSKVIFFILKDSWNI